jgi:hypothetical protein
MEQFILPLALGITAVGTLFGYAITAIVQSVRQQHDTIA